MKIRQIHRLFGALLLAPMIVWAITGLIFFIKPGYSEAYAPLNLPTQPLTNPIELPAMPDATELKLLNTPLGPSLLVRGNEGWQHYDLTTMAPKPEPDASALRQLVEPAIASDPGRYGRIEAIDGLTVTTDTGVRIKLHWPTLRLSQYGKDTARIDWFYKLHYLQWTGHQTADRVLGFAGLVLVMAMALTGLKMLFDRRKTS